MNTSMHMDDLFQNEAQRIENMAQEAKKAARERGSAAYVGAKTEPDRVGEDCEVAKEREIRKLIDETA